MKTCKRSLSVLLAAVMMTSILYSSASATGVPEILDESYTQTAENSGEEVTNTGNENASVPAGEVSDADKEKESKTVDDVSGNSKTPQPTVNPEATPVSNGVETPAESSGPTAAPTAEPSGEQAQEPEPSLEPAETTKPEETVEPEGTETPRGNGETESPEQDSTATTPESAKFSAIEASAPPQQAKVDFTIELIEPKVIPSTVPPEGTTLKYRLTVHVTEADLVATDDHGTVKIEFWDPAKYPQYFSSDGIHTKGKWIQGTVIRDQRIDQSVDVAIEGENTFRIGNSSKTKEGDVLMPEGTTVSADFTILYTGEPFEYVAHIHFSRGDFNIPDASQDVNMSQNGGEPKTGSFTLKKVVDGTGAPQSDTFTIKLTADDGITLENTAGKYGDAGKVSVNVESRTITIDGLKSEDAGVTLKDLPVGGYTFTEDPVPENYTLEGITGDGVSGNNGAGYKVTVSEGGNSVVTVTNTYTQPRGQLTIKKSVTGTPSESWTFTFTVTNKNGEPLENDNIHDGKVTISGSGNSTQQVTLNDVPIGEYTITEDDAPYYTETTKPQEANVTKDSPTTVEFENEYTPPEPGKGSLTIKKIVEGRTNFSGLSYTFTIKPMDGQSVEEKTLTINMTGKETTGTVDGLPVGSYTITEDTVNLSDVTTTYQVDGVEQQNGTATVEVKEGNPSTVTVTNTYTKGDLAISKTVEGDPTGNNPDRDFYFTVKLTGTAADGTDGTSYAGNVDYLVDDKAPAGGPHYSFSGGVSQQIPVKAGHTVTLQGLPAGLTYTVTEEPQAGYTPQGGRYTQEGTIQGGAIETAAFTNTYAFTSLTIKNTVEDQANPNGTFSFAVMLLQDNTKTNPVSTISAPRAIAGEQYAPINGTYTITATKGTLTSISGGVPDDPNHPFNQNDFKNSITGDKITFNHGLAGFDLTCVDGEAVVTIEGLPDGADFLIKEINEGEYIPNYTTIGGSDNGFDNQYHIGGGIATGPSGAEVDIVNKYDGANLTVSKKVIGQEILDQSFPFTVTLTSADGSPMARIKTKIRQADGSDAIVDIPGGKYEFSLKNGENIVLYDLPNGTHYEVVEGTMSGTADYIAFPDTGSSGMKGDIEQEPLEVKVVNACLPDTLVVYKEAPNQPGDEAATKYKFEIRLSGDAYNSQEDTADHGTDRDGNPIQFVDGVATFELAAKEYQMIRDLPEDVGITVTEQSEGDFTTAYTVRHPEGSDIEDRNGEGKTVTGKFDLATSGALVTFTNAYNTGDLTISNTEKNHPQARPLGTSFPFCVTLTKKDGSPFEYDGFGDLDTPVKHEGGGVYTFSLHDKDTVSFPNLPTDISYKVEQINANQDGYKTTYTLNETVSAIAAKGETEYTAPVPGVIKAGTDVSIGFINTYQSGDLTVSKAVTGGGPDSIFNFTIAKLNESGTTDTALSGNYGTDTAGETLRFLNGVAHFNLKNSEKAEFKDLPAGEYLVREADYQEQGYTTTYQGGTPADGGGVKVAVLTDKTVSVSVSNTYSKPDKPDEPPNEPTTPPLFPPQPWWPWPDHTAPTTTPSATPESGIIPKTGDETPIGLIATLAAVAVIGLMGTTVLFATRRKKKSGRKPSAE